MSNSWVESVPNYIVSFSWDDDLALLSYRYPLIAGAVYLVALPLLRRCAPRVNQKLIRGISAVHNVNMLILSIVMFLGMLVSVISIYTLHGPLHTIEILLCDAHRRQGQGALYFWIYAFYLSKFYELFDTVLIALRGGRFTVLHVYHHWATALLCLVSIKNRIPYQWAPCLLNAFVHIPMYHYYYRSLRKKPQSMYWKRFITLSQISQFVLDIAIAYLSYRWNKVLASPHNLVCSSWEGGVNWPNAIAISIIFSYLLLFIDFYKSTYRRRRVHKPEASGLRKEGTSLTGLREE